MREQQCQRELELPQQKQKQQGPSMEGGGDPRAVIPVIGGLTYSTPVPFDDVATEAFSTILNIPWFRRQAVLGDAQSDFVALDNYSWER